VVTGHRTQRARDEPSPWPRRGAYPPASRDAELVLTDEILERIEALVGAVLELLEGLPPLAREAVKARVVDERDYPDIARDLRCSEAVVRERVSRGLTALRDELEETT
jgi:DNA-directed RNA polymerase specialized sigma24 family protein